MTKTPIVEFALSVGELRSLDKILFNWLDDGFEVDGPRVDLAVNLRRMIAAHIQREDLQAAKGTEA